MQNNFFWFVIIVLLFLLSFFIKKIKFIIKVITRSFFCLSAIYIINIIFVKHFNLEQACLGLNFTTGITGGLFGLPGIIFLYLTKNIL